jgi:SAM-dependent methyltransferase
MDVITLKQFYSSALGQNVARHITTAIRRRWYGNKQDITLGLGFTMPYLDAMSAEGIEMFAFMPAEQGAILWPATGAGRVAMVQENTLPLQDASVNRIVCAHVLEHTRQVQETLEEMWHVLQAGGRALIIVPQRRSFWAGSATTPFGFGQPFSLMQLHQLVTGAGFTYVGYSTALYAPPVRWRWLLKASNFLELLGRLCLPSFGGVLIMEVEKQIYATISAPVRAESRGLFGLGVRAAPTPSFQRNYP